jgi:broad specificity phosphatase PhoE
MSTLALLRHGPTEWNHLHRLQGRTDLPLSPEGRALVATWRLHTDMGLYRWWSSPLRRCRETAQLLARAFSPPPEIAIEPRLIEMSYGAWEGSTLEELRRRHGEQMVQWEARGLDMQPPDGESPRQVQERLQPWLKAIASDRHDCFAVVHKGVIRALYALATGWTMETKAPHRLANDCLQIFTLRKDGQPAVQALNLPLAVVPGADETAA